MGWKLVNHIHTIPRKHLQFERIKKGWLSLTDVATSSVEFNTEKNVMNPVYSFVVSRNPYLPDFHSFQVDAFRENFYIFTPSPFANPNNTPFLNILYIPWN